MNTNCWETLAASVMLIITGVALFITLLVTSIIFFCVSEHYREKTMSCEDQEKQEKLKEREDRFERIAVLCGYLGFGSLPIAAAGIGSFLISLAFCHF